MNNETLKIFDDNKKTLGVATREEVHTKGLWHETFQCWIISHEENKTYIHLQVRSPFKKDWPNLLDITAAGHLLEHESIKDGVRELKEEIGLDVPFESLIPLEVVRYCVKKGSFIDNEFAHVFLLENNQPFDDYHLQHEEVSGMVKVKFEDFKELFLGNKTKIEIQGFTYNEESLKEKIHHFVSKDQFVPHSFNYYEKIIQLIDNKIS
ncbi:NUDIX domain-containing protein [Bacillus carboniphilus]|uniref:NUDIX domain-containing protein n=1 Tax=Bacillus carboniphilus TaxID=86663 RepID=A0ABY9JUL6_9BACI|nr:NUDIX domain-containing protein [Bacillus carboniphilus]WLR42120.1 NUDIX domain-containing protein [Bacillus carboniphilus]